MIKDNKSDNGEVDKDQTPEAEVIAKTVPITDDDIAADIISPDVPEKKEEKKDDKGKSDDEDQKTKSDEDKKDEKKDNDKDEKPFAVIGTQKFKTQEDLLKFTKSQVGFNTWLIGNVKKVHPEWFDKDGSLKTDQDFSKIVAVKDKVKDAADTVAAHADKSADEMTDEEKEELKKAKAILKKLGVVMTDDEEYKTLHQKAQKIDEQEVEKARTVIDSFSQKHPLLEEHREQFAEFLDNTKDRNYNSLEKAWNVYKVENDIVEEVVEKKDDDDGGEKKRKAVDTVIPKTISKGSGGSPARRSEPDLMDDLIGTQIM